MSLIKQEKRQIVLNQLLVIGNGFDLANGVKTSYSSFFESDYFQCEKEKAFRWRKFFNEQGIMLYRNLNFIEFDDMNWWALLFCLESEGRLNSAKAIKWCDVENVIYNSLTNSKSDSFSWEFVREVLNNRASGRKHHMGDPPNYRLLELDNSNINIKIVAEYLYQLHKQEDYCFDKTAFYKQLLLELNKFEELFGLYIKQATSSRTYYDDAWNLVNRLLGTKSDVQIDSFNYSDFSTSSTYIRHVNGDYDAPIFGINLSVEEEDKYPELRQFTKTSRWIHQDIENLNKNTVWKSLLIDKAVVFGHSLNQMDYDYYYYLFTLLQFHTFDLKKWGELSFGTKIMTLNMERSSGTTMQIQYLIW